MDTVSSFPDDSTRKNGCAGCATPCQWRVEGRACVALEALRMGLSQTRWLVMQHRTMLGQQLAAKGIDSHAVDTLVVALEALSQ